MADPVFAADALSDEMAISPWSGHRHLVYDLIRFAAPRAIVELGTHIGGSFFAMCQAVQDRGLATEIYAVDTWQGDPHAGFYGEEVYEGVVRILASCFPGRPFHLLRMLFSEAVERFADGSLDLIHIDGLHTYEAVAEDLRTWLPKLRPDGVILFHDVAPDCGYGSAKFWQEVASRYPHFLFTHSWGLGMLFPRGDGLYKRMLAQQFPLLMPIYRYRAERDLGRERARRDLAWQRKQTDLQWERAEALARDLGEARAQLGQREAELGHRDAQLRAQAEQLNEIQNSLSMRLARQLDRFPALRRQLKRAIEALAIQPQR